MKKCAALNRCYRVIWNRSRGAWAVVSEHAGGFGKGGGRSKSKRSLKGWLLLVPLAMLAASILPPDSMAAPVGGQVTAGQGHITQSGNTTTIHQASQHLSLNWKRFNIAPAETVNFRQPGVSAVAVNRISDINGSRIMGHLNANGQVYLINPNGILFGKNAEVNVGGLVASTLNIPDSALGNANQTFAGSGTGAIINNGTIHASNGGYVALLGNRVSNNGIITARLGTVALGAGNQVTLSFNGNNLLKLQVDKSVLHSLAANHGLIQADGGLVAMNAGARDSLLASVVNNDGIVQAQTVQQKHGKIVLLGGMQAGTTQVAGTLDASAPNGGNGGFIETSAARVKVANSAKITTKAANGLNGTWLIDPKDFTIAATGGGMTGTALTTSLGNGSVIIQSSGGGTAGSGDINVNDAVSWSKNLLTLTAAKDVNINAVMSATGSAALALNPGTANGAATAVAGGTVNVKLTGTGFTGRVDLATGTSLNINGTPYTIINSLGAGGSTTKAYLQKTYPQGMGGNYVLGGNIDASGTATWNAGAGFTPIGNAANKFTGIFDGLGHTITGLTINRPTTNPQGLFGQTGSSALLRNVGLVGGSVSGSIYVGMLVGYGSGTISNSYATGAVTGSLGVGGLVGRNGGSISNSYATGAVTGSSAIVGGLVGYDNGTISNSYATGAVTGSSNVGGLVAYDIGTISNSYATGAVTGSSKVGGLVGRNDGSISNSYATGAVTGSSNVGGLVGRNGGSISNSYATGAVTGSSNVGGLVGSLYGNVRSTFYSFWDKTTTGQATSAGGGKGLTTPQMQTQSSFTTPPANWDFANTWVMYAGKTYPLLRSFMTPLTVTPNTSKVYDGSKILANADISFISNGKTIVNPGSNLLGSLSTSSKTVSGGPHTVTNGLYSNQQGYIISYVSKTVRITPASIAVTGLTASSKVYDANATESLGGTAAITALGTDSVTLGGSASGTFANKNVGTNKAVTVTGNTISGADASNYNLVQQTGLKAAVTQANLNVTGLTASSKVYDANTTESLGGTAAITALGTDSVTLGGSASGTFANKNVGTNKAVTVTGKTISGTDASNYNLVQQMGLKAAVTQANLNVTGLTASSKVYDANRAAILNNTGAGFTGRLGNDVLNVASATGVFANKNAGTGKNVSISGITLGGADSTNYNLTKTTATTTANITPATLIYSATPVHRIQAQPLPAFSGTVTGFVGGETLGATTTGALAWTSPATSSNTPGSFAIDGGGLTATNYLFSQAGGNATALTIQPGRADSFVESIVTQAQSLMNLKIPSQSGRTHSNHVRLKVKGFGIRLPKLLGG